MNSQSPAAQGLPPEGDTRSVGSLVEGLAALRGALLADRRGQILETVALDRSAPGQGVAEASVVSEFDAAGAAVGLHDLELLLVRGQRATTVTAVRPAALLRVWLEPFLDTGEVERRLRGWELAQAPGAPGPEASPDAWAALRRALVRGQLTEAAARARGLAPPADDAARVAEDRDRAMEALLEGVGSILAGDAPGGARRLRDLAAATERNVSFRWLALHWSTWASLRSGALPAARAHLKESLVVAPRLDVEARAVTQWTAAEVMAHDGDPIRALAWLKESRGRFERLADAWGLGQTWLSEARALASMGREAAAIEAAGQARAASPAWDEPAIFLARRALLRDDPAGAEALLEGVAGLAAERVRALVAAVHGGVLSQADASEVVLLQDAPPSAQTILALERIARAAPDFTQARDALAWCLLKLGRSAEAGALFRGLQALDLPEAERASVLLGLSCLAHEQQVAERPEARLAPLLAASSLASAPTAPAGPALADRPAEAALAGRLGDFALSDLVEFLRSARRTGVLVYSSPAGMAALRFRQGRLCGAACSGMPNLGQLLVAGGRLSQAALEAALRRQPADRPDLVIGELLVKVGLVEVADVEAALEQQVVLTVQELTRWRDGEFAFNREDGREATAASIEISLDPQAVLLSALKETDEAGRNAPAAPGDPWI